MKRIIVTIMAISLLSGCGIKSSNNSQPVKQGKMLILEEKGKVIENVSGYDERGNKLPNLIDYSKLEKSDISILQKASEYYRLEDSTADVYIDNKNNLIIVKDNSFTETYNNNISIPKDYIGIINKVSDYNMRYSDGTINGKYDRLDFVNDEYVVCNPASISIFSIKYDNVYININNMPVKIIAYIDNNKAVRLHITGLKISYAQNKLTNKNRESISNTLSALGVNNSNELTEEFEKYIEDKSTSDKIGEYNINYNDNSYLSEYNNGQNKFIQKDMIISLN